MAQNYYETLGVPKEASQDDIKKAYRRLSKQYHPDVNPNDKNAEDIFKKINEAYSILGDENKRKEYDNPMRGGFGGGFPPGFDIFNDFFGSNFGGFQNQRQNRNRSQTRGNDLRINLGFTLEEVMSGTVKHFRYNRQSRCSNCNGNGSREGKSLVNCQNCGGLGMVIQSVQTPFGRIQTNNSCGVCSGSGKIIEYKCDGCGGLGIKEESEEISINIPEGISDGFVYKIENGGNHTNGSQNPGDLILVCAIKNHETYKRFGSLDLHRDVFISLIDAIRGNDDFRINVFGEELKLKIESGSDNGKILRLKGKGLKGNGGIRGDLFVHLNIYIPKNLNDDAINKLNEHILELTPNESHINYETGSLSRSMKFGQMYVG